MRGRYLLAFMWLVLLLTVSQNVLGWGNLENPAPGTTQSGIGVISGWYCDANLIEVVFDDRPPKVAAYGTNRIDTESVCGDSDNGFSLLWAYGLLGEGSHRVRVYADGVEFADAAFMVGVINEGEYLRGASGSFGLVDFPESGTDTEIVWTQSTQNFTVAGSHPSTGTSTAIKYLSPVVIDGDDSELGTLISTNDNHSLLTVMSAKGYIFQVRPDGYVEGEDKIEGGNIVTLILYHSNEDCTGQTYVLPAPWESSGLGFIQVPTLYHGRVFSTHYASTLYYVPKNEPAPTVSTFRSQSSGYNCNTTNPTERKLIKAYINNPSITGVANKGISDPVLGMYTGGNPYPQPITLHRP